LTLYKDNFDLLDFVNTSYNSYKKFKPKFDDFEEEIKQRLETASPIFTFIYIVACKRLAEKKERSIEETKDYIEKIWQFTHEYDRGLYELAKNIVEHSGQAEEDGQGMIRAYSKDKIDKDSDSDKTKVLETHVFDYGETGVIQKLKEYTDKRIKSHEKELSDSQRKVNKAYKTDSVTLENGFTLDDFIKGRTLEQQKFRHIGHYGINKLQKLVEDKKILNGEMIVASKRKDGQPDRYGENAENLTIKRGTHYYFKIPFIANNFGKIDTPTSKQPRELYTLGSSDTLQKLMKKGIELDIVINEKIDKKFVDNIDTHFGYLSKLNQTIVVALNLEDCTIDGESNLLRFLGYLTEEYKQSFVIYANQELK